MPSFEFASPERVIFGLGVVQRLGELAQGLLASAPEKRRRALVVSGISRERSQLAETSLTAAGMEAVSFHIAEEPTVAAVLEGVRFAQREGCSLVVSLGGGSAIDTGKAVAALLANPGEALDYLEVVGKGKALHHPALPHIAIPTTAGTGAEVTRNAVLKVPERGVKVSLRGLHVLPRIALVDPELTLSLPPDVTAYTGMDALTQLVEPFVSNRANPISDALCREGLGRAAGALRRAYHDGADRSAREDMALASLFSGLALANSKLGTVHGFAGVLGGRLPAAHGVLCARLLPGVMRANVEWLQRKEADHPALGRYVEVARLLTGEPEAKVMEGVKWVEALCEELAIPRLSDYGLSRTEFPAVIEKTQRASSTQGNPIVLDEGVLSEILEGAY